MPKITSNADLYNSDYEELTARFELYEVLKQGLDDIEAWRTIPADEFLAELEARNSGSKKWKGDKYW